MEKLFNDSETFTNVRPVKLTPEQFSDFVKEQAIQIKKDGFSRSDVEDIQEDLRRIDFPDSGYETAKQLEQNGGANYRFDAMFIEHLECLQNDYETAIENNVKAWVKAHNIQPKYKTGSELKSLSRLYFGCNANDPVFITGYDPKLAVYYLNQDRNGNGGVVLPYEKVDKLTELIAE